MVFITYLFIFLYLLLFILYIYFFIDGQIIGETFFKDELINEIVLYKIASIFFFIFFLIPTK